MRDYNIKEIQTHKSYLKLMRDNMLAQKEVQNAINFAIAVLEDLESHTAHKMKAISEKKGKMRCHACGILKAYEGEGFRVGDQWFHCWTCREKHFGETKENAKTSD